MRYKRVLKKLNDLVHDLKSGFLKSFDLARIRTWNLLIRSQTRYPLRHKALIKIGFITDLIPNK